MKSLPSDFMPLKYDSSYETPAPDEAETIQEIIDTMSEIQQKTYQKENHALRSVHAKSHAIVKGRLEVYNDLPPYLAQGFFAKPGTYDIVMRISTQPGDVLPDSVSTPRGFAIKVFGVDGEKLPQSDETDTQDFILVNSPVFPQKLKDFLNGLKRFDKLTNKAEGFKEGVSKVLRTVGEATGSEAGVMAGMGGQPATHPMGDVYYSQTASLYGEYMAKFSLTPITENLTSLKGKEIEIDKDDGQPFTRLGTVAVISWI